MNGTLSSIVIFAAGAAIGSVVTWKIVKTKYERIAQDEIDSVKEVLSRKENKYSGPQDSDAEEESEDEDEDKIDVKSYAAILAEEGYVNYSDMNEEKGEKAPVNTNKPYVISPDEFGEMDGYKTVSLSYWADNVLTYDRTNKLVEDVDKLIGKDALNHFGDYENDAVHVRNDDMKCDFEILVDLRRYSDVMKGRTSHRMEE